MRIALSNPDVNLAGGVERVVVAAANHLSQRGHEVTVYASRIDEAVLAPGVGVRRIHVPAGLDARTGLGFRGTCARAIRADCPDVHGAFGTLSPLGGVFWVPSVHKVGYEFLLGRRDRVSRLPMQLNPYHRVRLRLERSMFAPGGCALALAQTEAVRSDILRFYGGVTQVGVLPLGYDDAAFQPGRRARRRADARQQFGYAPDDRVLLFAANELERKGFDTMLQAAARLSNVKILGAGRETPSPRMLDSSGVGGAFQWVGHVSDIGVLHAAADALVLPTRYEPWGLVIVEALGSGLPVVTSRLAGAAVTVKEGVTGRLLDDPDDVGMLAEAIRWALSDAPAAPSQIAASVRDYTWAEIIARYEAALGEVASNS